MNEQKESRFYVPQWYESWYSYKKNKFSIIILFKAEISCGLNAMCPQQVCAFKHSVQSCQPSELFYEIGELFGHSI